MRRIQHHRSPTLAGTVTLEQLRTEPSPELGLVFGRGLGAEAARQLVVGVIGPLRRGQQVSQRLADVREKRSAEVPDIG